MIRIVVEESVTRQLRGIAEPCELVDSAGNKLGFFQPEAVRSLYEGLDSPASDEELDRRESQGGGRPLSEILADLSKGHR